MTCCDQWCWVRAIIVIIGKWAPSRSGYRVIINSIYSLLFPRTHNFTQSRASLPPSSAQLKSVRRLAAATTSWDELHENSEEERVCGGCCGVREPRPGECAADRPIHGLTPGGPEQTKEANLEHSNTRALLSEQSQLRPDWSGNHSRLARETNLENSGAREYSTSTQHSTVQCYYWPRATLALVASWLIQNDTQDSITMRIDGR